MSLADRVLRRFLAAQEPVRQQIGPFTVEYHPTLAATAPKVGDALLEAARLCTGAGFPIPSGILVQLNGSGVSHGFAAYYPGSSPPLIKVPPKAYAAPGLVKGLVHELGHFYHDRIVPGGMGNTQVTSKYAWARRQVPTGAGSSADQARAKMLDYKARTRALEEEHEALGKATNVPRKGAKVEFDYRHMSGGYHVIGTVLGKAGKHDVLVEVHSPEKLIELVKRIPPYKPVITVSTHYFSELSPEALARRAEITKELAAIREEAQAFYDTHVKDVDHFRYDEEHHHDWMPTSYAKKTAIEWFAEMFTTLVLGHLKPEPSEWLRSIIRTGAAPR